MEEKQEQQTKIFYYDNFIRVANWPGTIGQQFVHPITYPWEILQSTSYSTLDHLAVIAVILSHVKEGMGAVQEQ